MNYRYYLRQPILYGAGVASVDEDDAHSSLDFETRLANLMAGQEPSGYPGPPVGPPPGPPVGPPPGPPIGPPPGPPIGPPHGPPPDNDDLEARFAILQQRFPVLTIQDIEEKMTEIEATLKEIGDLEKVKIEINYLIQEMINYKIIDGKDDKSIVYKAEQLLRKILGNPDYNMMNDDVLKQVTNEYIDLNITLVNEKRTEYINDVLTRAGVQYDRLSLVHFENPGGFATEYINDVLTRAGVQYDRLNPGFAAKAFYELALNELINDLEELEEEELTPAVMEYTILELFDEYTNNYFANRTPL